MGMDVYGRAPKSPKGEYFRNNVWWWHPLWGMVESLYPALVENVTGGHYNEGDGLDEEGASALAYLLFADLDSGRITAFVDQYEETRKNLPMEVCSLCEGKGVMTLGFGPQSGEERECGRCQGVGMAKAFGTNYPMSVDNVRSFAEFCADSGGFEIC